MGRAKREIISGMLYRERVANRKPETRGMNLMPLMFFPHRQKLSLKEVSTVPMACCKVKVSHNVLRNVWCVITHPSCSLLQVTGEGVWHSAKLQGFVNVSGLPSFAKHERRGCNILSKGSQGNHSNVFYRFATENIAGSSAPSNP